MVVLGSQEVARDLLDKRSSIYSDRPSSLMIKLYVDTVAYRLELIFD